MKSLGYYEMIICIGTGYSLVNTKFFIANMVSIKLLLLMIDFELVKLRAIMQLHAY
jgi:hypothetical protein